MKKLLMILFMTLALMSVGAQISGALDLGKFMETVEKQYAVAKGDNLQLIAESVYGDRKLWPVLWLGNKDAVRNPARIEIGDKLKVFKLPFAANAYGEFEKRAIAEAYAGAYQRYLELGTEWTGERRWVLLESLAFDADFFVTQYSIVTDEDRAWFEGRNGVTISAPVENVSLTFVETSDIHGAIFPYNFITAKPMTTSLAQVATLVAQNKAEGKDVVLLDDGDSLQGQPTVYFYNFEKTGTTHIWSEALNYLDYDAVAVGNHDIEAGHPVYDKLYREIRASVLCANAVKEDGTPYFTPYRVIERQGVKIAILGLTSPKIPDWLPPQFWTGMKFEDMVVSAKKWVPIIQAKEKPDVIVGLFHAGVDYTYGGTKRETPNNENASQLVAEQVPGFDMIFVGHDHQGWDGMGYDPAAKAKAEVKDPNGKTVYIYGALNAARKIPVVSLDMSWDKASKTWTKSVKGSLVDLSTTPADPDFVAKFQPKFDEIKTWVDRPVGKMVGTITTKDSMFGDSAFVDLIHRIQLEICADPTMGLKKADISFAAPLAQNATIPSSADGTLFVRDMFNLYVYENFLYTMTLTGQQVKDFLEYSYSKWFTTMPNEGNHIIAFQMKDGKLVIDPRYNTPSSVTAYYNYDSAAGINYTVDVTKPAGERVVIQSMADGSAFEPAKTYTVAINSYRGQGGGGHLEQGAKLAKPDILAMKFVTSATTKDLRFYLLKWFEKQSGPITVGAIGNWKVIPEDLAALGKETDLPNLYPPATK